MMVIQKLYVMEEKEVEEIGILSLQQIKLQDILNLGTLMKKSRLH